jgi:hypothetical protein
VLATVRRNLVLLAAGALVLAVAPAAADAKKKRPPPSAKRPAKRPKKPAPPTNRWYRLAVSADGTFASTPPFPGQPAETLDMDMRWSGRSRTAFIVARSDLADPTTGKLAPGYSFAAGVAGELASSHLVQTIYTPMCTPDRRGFRQTSAAGIEGTVTGYLPVDGKQASVNADAIGLAAPDPPQRPTNGFNWWSAYRCTNDAGRVYTEPEVPPDRPATARLPMNCGWRPGLLNMRYRVKGKVRFGRRFTVTVHCESSSTAGAAVSGVTSRKTIEYSFTFTPCPKGGLTTKRC